MDTTDFLRDLDAYVDNTLIPAIASNLSGLFPSLNFRLHTGGYWYSDTSLSGVQYRGDTVLFAKYNKGRLTIGANNPTKAGIDKYAKAGAQGIDVITLYRALNGNPTYTEAVKKIAEELGVSLAGYPKGKGTYDIRPAEDKDTAKEAFIAALWGSSAEAEAARKFLHEKGYSDTEIKEAELGLATPEVVAELEKSAPRWYPREAEGKPLPTAYAQGIGGIWKIAVPMLYGSKVDSFNFRTIGTPPEGKAKYKVPTGLKRDIFSGLTTTSRESLILVEGELDALKARINGIPNVVSYGMNYISIDKVRNAVRRGITKFTVIPDNDTKEGVAATMQAGVRNIAQSISNLYEGGATEVYVAPLPIVEKEGTGRAIKDTEEYIATLGVEVWKDTVRESKLPAVAYLVNRAFVRYTEKGEFTAEDRAGLLNELEGILLRPYFDKYSQREEAYAVIRAWINEEGNTAFFRFTEEGLKKYIEGKRDREAKAKREAAYTKDIAEAAALAQAGELREADAKITASRSRNFAKNTEAEVGALFSHPATVEEAEAEISRLPEGLSTGLYFLTGEGEIQELTLKEGVSLLVGARKHGKTTLLCNMALNAAAENIRLYKEGVDTELKKVLFISYEVTYARLLQKLLAIYLNNPKISNNSARSILAYYKGKEDTYFSQNSEGEKEGYKDFLSRKDAFYKDYINSGALTILTADKVLEKANKALTIENLVAYLDTYLLNNKVSLIALDYIQEIASERRYGTRVEELKYIGEELRNFANPRKVPFLCAAQFNRQIQSLIDLDTKNIGEAGDLERNGVDIIATFNLKELGYIRGSKSPEIDTAENVERLHRFGIDNSTKDLADTIPPELRDILPSSKKGIVLTPVPGKMYIRLLASRYDAAPAEVVTDFVESTGYIDIAATRSIVSKAAAKEYADKAKGGTAQAVRELDSALKLAEKKKKAAEKDILKLEAEVTEAEIAATNAKGTAKIAKAQRIWGQGEDVEVTEKVAAAKEEKLTTLKQALDRRKQAKAEAEAEIAALNEKKAALENAPTSAAPASPESSSVLKRLDTEGSDTEGDAEEATGENTDLPF